MDKLIDHAWRTSQALVVGLVCTYMTLTAPSTWAAVVFNAIAYGMALQILWRR